MKTILLYMISFLMFSTPNVLWGMEKDQTIKANVAISDDFSGSVYNPRSRRIIDRKTFLEEKSAIAAAKVEAIRAEWGEEDVREFLETERYLANDFQFQEAKRKSFSPGVFLKITSTMYKYRVAILAGCTLAGIGVGIYAYLNTCSGYSDTILELAGSASPAVSFDPAAHIDELLMSTIGSSSLGLGSARSLTFSPSFRSHLEGVIASDRKRSALLSGGMHLASGVAKFLSLLGERATELMQSDYELPNGVRLIGFSRDAFNGENWNSMKAFAKKNPGYNPGVKTIFPASWTENTVQEAVETIYKNLGSPTLEGSDVIRGIFRGVAICICYRNGAIMSAFPAHLQPVS